MVRTQTQLTEEQTARLKELAHLNNEPSASFIRKAVDQFLAREEPDRRTFCRQVLAVEGRHRTGVQDVAFEHDGYLEEEFRK